MGRPFAAALKLNDEYRLEFDFGEEQASEEEQDLSQLVVVGKCPKCGGKIYEGTTSYFCEHTLGTRTCDFRCGRVILQQEINREQIEKILGAGRSDLLPNFVSKRNNRKFKAYLVLDKKTGKIGFEFEPRTTDEKPKVGTRRIVRKTAENS